MPDFIDLEFKMENICGDFQPLKIVNYYVQFIFDCSIWLKGSVTNKVTDEIKYENSTKIHDFYLSSSFCSLAFYILSTLVLSLVDTSSQ